MGRQVSANRGDLAARPAHRHGQLRRSQKVAVNRVIDVGAHAPVEVLGCVDDAVGTFAGPPSRCRRFLSCREVVLQAPCRLPEGGPHRLNVDVAIGTAHGDGLKSSDGPPELLAGSGVLSGSPECFLRYTDLQGRHAYPGVIQDGFDNFRPRLGVAEERISLDGDVAEDQAKLPAVVAGSRLFEFYTGRLGIDKEYAQSAFFGAGRDKDSLG